LYNKEVLRVSQTNNKSSMLGIIFGLGIVVAFIVVLLIIGENNVTESSKKSDIAQHAGKVIYEKACVACHKTGVLNAPKLGDKVDWEKRIIKGEDILLQNAADGFNTMPPRGGTFLSDADLKQAVQYMLYSIEPKDHEEISQVAIKSSVSKPVKTIDQSSGKAIYDKVCMACHTSGILNAPKLGNKDDWQARIEKGEAVLVQNSIKGFNTMPPRGGSFVNDADMQLAVQYMLTSVGFEVVAVQESPSPVVEVPKKLVKTVVEPVVEKTPVKPVLIVKKDISHNSGKIVYDRVCMACHTSGILNAPKLGNKDDWQARIEKGEATLLQNSIKGFNTMPPRGGNFVNDADMQLAVQYMLASVGYETSSPSSEPVKIAKVVTTPKISEPLISKEPPKEVIKIDIPVKVSETPKIIPKPEIPKVSKVIPEPETPKINTNIPPISSAITSPKQGKDIYEMTCKSCHIVGIAGAPKIAEKKDWEQRISKGEDVLVQNAIKGINIMPPRGGNSNLTDEEIKLAVQYMLKAIPNR